jgi:hypothetical protein
MVDESLGTEVAGSRRQGMLAIEVSAADVRRALQHEVWDPQLEVVVVVGRIGVLGVPRQRGVLGGAGRGSEQRRLRQPLMQLFALSCESRFVFPAVVRIARTIWVEGEAIVVA